MRILNIFLITHVVLNFFLNMCIDLQNRHFLPEKDALKYCFEGFKWATMEDTGPQSFVS